MVVRQQAAVTDLGEGVVGGGADEAGAAGWRGGGAGRCWDGKAVCWSLAGRAGHCARTGDGLRCGGAQCTLEKDKGTCCEEHELCSGYSCPDGYLSKADSKTQHCKGLAAYGLEIQHEG